MIVCKFGGTSVTDTAAFRRLISIIGKRTGERPLIVVSALAGVTDGLLAKKPADRLTGEQARMALLDIQQHEHELFLRDVRVTRDGKQSSAAAGAQAVFVLRSCCCAIGRTGALQR